MLDEEGGEPQTEETQFSETKEVEPEPAEDKDTEADEEDSRRKGQITLLLLLNVRLGIKEDWRLLCDLETQIPFSHEIPCVALGKLPACSI